MAFYNQSELVQVFITNLDYSKLSYFLKSGPAKKRGVSDWLVQIYKNLFSKSGVVQIHLDQLRRLISTPTTPDHTI